MSYELVKSIKVDQKLGKVFVTCASNNVFPRTYERVEFTTLSKLLVDEGVEEVDARILRLYEEGSFQGGSNKYTRALKALRYELSEEYSKFNWRNHNARYGTPEYEAERALRESDEFKDLLKKALKIKVSKNKILARKHYGEEYYAKYYARSGTIRWVCDDKKASKLEYNKEWEEIINSFKMNDYDLRIMKA